MGITSSNVMYGELLSGDVMASTAQRPWITKECSQPATSILNRNRLVVSRIKAFLRRPTNYGLTLPRTAQVEDGVIGCHKCYHFALSECSGISPGFVSHPCQPPSQSSNRVADRKRRKRKQATPALLCPCGLRRGVVCELKLANRPICSNIYINI